MKAKIAFNFAKLFFYKEDAWEDEDKCCDAVEVNWTDVSSFEVGEEVEVLKIVESQQFSGGKGFVIYNPKNNASTTVSRHVLTDLTE